MADRSAVQNWKSHFQLGRLPSCNPLWVQIQLLVKLLAIALLQSTFAPNLFVAELRALSPLKIAAYFFPPASPHYRFPSPRLVRTLFLFLPLRFSLR